LRNHTKQNAPLTESFAYDSKRLPLQTDESRREA
jgi:hypothetical protein